MYSRTYDDSWLRFIHWAAGQGIDQLGPTAAQIDTFCIILLDSPGLSPQTSKGFRSCLASVSSRTGKAVTVQANYQVDL